MSGSRKAIDQGFRDRLSEAVDVQELARSNERLREQQDAISNVLRAVVRSGELQPVLDEVATAAMRLCASEYAMLYVVDGDVLLAVAGVGGVHQLEWDKEHPHAFDRTTWAGRTAVTREIVHVPDVHEDTEYAYPGPRTGFRAGLGVPVLFEDDLIGVLLIVREQPQSFTDDQIQLVQTFADQVAVTIANARLTNAVERQRTELARFVSPQVAELLSSERGEQMLAGHRAYIACLYCDLRGSTAFAETAAPEEVVELMREYHRLIGDLTHVHRGTLEHFAGDGLMVFFNDPVPVENHELEACRMALALNERFRSLADVWRKRGSDIGLGVGLAAGYATIGRIGFEGRYDYGVIGPVVNLAARLSSHAASGQTLINQRLLAEIEDDVDAEPVGELELKGFGRPVPAFELLALR
jgi:class 3 adenylate cyclase/putative methionine-R-sulfoxide reductase with GAF domain